MTVSLSCKTWNSAINNEPRLTNDIWFQYNLATEMKRNCHIKFSRLPPVQEHQLRFLNTSRCVRSVELTVDTEYFSNMTSLVLKQNGSDFVWTNTVPDSTLKLQFLESLEILFDLISLCAKSKLSLTAPAYP